MSDMLTRQEISDKIVRSLRKQGYRRAESQASGLPVLIDPWTGDRCAGGHLLPPDFAERLPHFDLLNPFSEVPLEIRLECGVSEDDKNFVAFYQAAHDEGRTPELMESKLKQTVEYLDMLWPTD